MYISSFNQANARSAKSNQMGQGTTLILIGDTENDTMMIRHYLLNTLKQEMNLDILKVTGSTRRTAGYFKQHIVDGT